MLTDFNVALGLVHKIGQKKKDKNSVPFYILIWLDAFYYLSFFFFQPCKDLFKEI